MINDLTITMMAARLNNVTKMGEATTAPYKALSFLTILHSYSLMVSSLNRNEDIEVTSCSTTGFIYVFYSNKFVFDQ